MALRTLEELNKDEYKIYATSRHVGLINENITEFNLDINNEMDYKQAIIDYISSMTDKFAIKVYEELITF